MPVDTSNKPKISEGRKSSKPLMEKRRRARINESLGQLKSLILEATNKDTSRHSKLEKADILEMTVRYLRNMQRHQLTGSGNPDPAMLNRYRLGYNECIGEVSRYLGNSDSSLQLRTTLIGHLANCCDVSQTTTGKPQQQTVAYTPAPTPSPVVATAAMGPPPPASQSIQVQIAPSSMSSVTTIPTASPSGTIARVVSGIPIGVPGGITGEITVVLPPQVLPGGQLPSHFIPVYAQSAPSLLSPTSSTSSQCLPSPTSSVETSTTHQAHRVSYQQVHSPELSPPLSYEQNQAVPQTVAMSYMQGVTVTSSPQSIVQAPTLVAMPANVLAPVAEPTTATLQQHPFHLNQQPQQCVAVSQPRIHPQSPAKTLLRTVNINVQQQQCASADENVWRPW